MNESPTACLSGSQTSRERLKRIALTPRQAQCLALHYYDGLSSRQIAAELGIGQRSVSQHISYGQRKIAAAKLTVREPSFDAGVRITHMDTDALDALQAEAIRAAW